MLNVRNTLCFCCKSLHWKERSLSQIRLEIDGHLKQHSCLKITEQLWHVVIIFDTLLKQKQCSPITEFLVRSMMQLFSV